MLQRDSFLFGIGELWDFFIPYISPQVVWQQLVDLLDKYTWELLICIHFSSLAEYLLTVLEGKTATFPFFFNSIEKQLNQADKGKGQMLHFKLSVKRHLKYCLSQSIHGSISFNNMAILPVSFPPHPLHYKQI